MNLLIIGNAICFAGSVIMTLMGLIKNRRRFLAAQSCMNVFFIAGNLCLGGISGAIANAVTMTRNLVCLKWNLNKVLKIFFITVQILLSICFGQTGIIALFPIIGACVFTWFMDTDNMVLLKAIIIGSQLLWLVYDISIRNYATVPFDIATCITNAVALSILIKEANKTSEET